LLDRAGSRRAIHAGRIPRAAYSTQKVRSGEAHNAVTPLNSSAALKHPFHDAKFLTTAADWRQLPSDGAPEVAFAGRSNAGKSSVINALAQRSRLAYISRTPGRTQHINFFRAPSGALLADLPGYGYAKVPAAVKRRWQVFLARYLAERNTLVGLVLVMDARHPLTELDRQMLDWFLPTGRPVRILLTKADKLSPTERRHTLQDACRAIARDYGAAMVGTQLFSATQPLGVTDAETAISAWLAPWESAAGAEKERPRHQGE
jgi:GTP-binding protein